MLVDLTSTMSSAPAAKIDRVFDALPGWLFVLCGLALVSIVVLTPAWLDAHETAWRLKVMQAQAQALHEQAQRYRDFQTALEADDPVVLERLAMTHLRMRLTGKWPIHTTPVTQDTADVGAWLAVSQPRIGRELLPYAAPDNRLTRLALGPGRAGLLAVGLLCLIAGLFFNPRSIPRTAIA